jgi:hypothetical protein
MNKKYSLDLDALRVATPASKWMYREAPLKALLRELGSYEAVRLAIHCVEAYLPKFKQSHPAENWSVNYLSKIKSAVSLSMFGELQASSIEGNGSDKISRSLASIMGSLRVSALNMNDLEKCVEEAAETIARVFEVEITDGMYQISPELFRLDNSLRGNLQEQMNASVMPGLRVRSLPEVKELEKNLWLGLADEIEKRLQAQSPKGGETEQ